MAQQGQAPKTLINPERETLNLKLATLADTGVKRNKKKILLYGPIPPPYTGQASAFIQVVQSFPQKETHLVNITRFRSTLINTLYTIVCTLYFFLFFQFDTVYFTSSRSLMGFVKDIPLLLLGRWLKKRMVNHLHGANFKSFYIGSGLLKPMIRYCYQKVGTSIVLFDGMKQEFSDFPDMKIQVVMNCYDKQFDVDDEAVFQKNNQVVFLSNLMKSKGILEFLDACDIILQRNKIVNIRIAGMFEKDASMKKTAISESFQKIYRPLKDKYQNRIHYLGVVKGREKVKLLYESDIFVLPTWHPSEAYPISIIEAMRTGNAIVTTNHNFLSAIVKPENGIIVNPKSSDEIACAIEALLKDRKQLRRIQQYNRTYAKETYNPETFIDTIRGVILNF